MKGLVEKLTVALALCAVLTLLFGCAGAYSPQDRLQLRVDQFNDNVRWGRYFSAAEFVDAENRAEWLASRREWGSQDLHIADYEVVDSTLGEDGTAVIRVVVSWYRLTQGELQTTMFAQRWRRQGRVWNLVEEEVEEGTPL